MKKLLFIFLAVPLILSGQRTLETKKFTYTQDQLFNKYVIINDTAIIKYQRLQRQTSYPSVTGSLVLLNYKDTLKIWDGINWKNLGISNTVVTAPTPLVVNKLVTGSGANTIDTVNVTVTGGGLVNSPSGFTKNSAVGDSSMASLGYTKKLINYATTGQLEDRGNYDASVNALPTTGGSGGGGSVATGDKWTITVKGIASGDSLRVGDIIIARANTPGQTLSNWNHIPVNQPVTVSLRRGGDASKGALEYTGTVKESGKYFSDGNNSYPTETGNNYLTSYNGGFGATYFRSTASGVQLGDPNSQNRTLIQTTSGNSNMFIYANDVIRTVLNPSATSTNAAYTYDTHNAITGNHTVFSKQGSAIASIDNAGKGTFSGLELPYGDINMTGGSIIVTSQITPRMLVIKNDGQTNRRESCGIDIVQNGAKVVANSYSRLFSIRRNYTGGNKIYSPFIYLEDINISAIHRDSINGRLIDCYTGNNGSGVNSFYVNPRLKDPTGNAITNLLYVRSFNKAKTVGAADLVTINDSTTTVFRLDSAGLPRHNIPHGAFYSNNDQTITATQNGWYNVELDNSKDAEYMTKTGDSIQLTKAGHYQIMVTVSFSGNTNDIYQLAVFKNNVLDEPSQERKTSSADVGNMSCPVYVSSDGNDWFVVKIRNTANNNDPTLRFVSVIISTIHLNL